MTQTPLDVIVVGAGQAGLTSSYYLKKHKLSHIVFERGHIAQSWISQRWRSFTLTSPNVFAVLPGDKYEGPEPEVHMGAPEFAAYLNDYVSRYKLPVREKAKVLSVEFDEASRLYHVAVSENEQIAHYKSKQVIIASGSMNVMIIPPVANKMPAGLRHVHAGEYRFPAQLPEGAVLVVGSAQSGSQIAEDLNREGRKVFLATSRVGRIPLIYRRKDIYHWVIDAVFFGVLMEKYGVPVDLSSPPSISLHELARRGVTLLGKLDKIEGDDLYFQLNVTEHIKYADQFSANVKKIIEAYIEEHKMEVDDPEYDQNDAPDELGCWDPMIPSINIKKENIQTVVWATGFGNDYSYVKLPIFNEEGYPLHNYGITEIGGLYFPGLYGGSSIHGIGDNVRHIMERVCQYAAEPVNEVTV